MIGWLEGWLREIVLVVLFAVVTDMLLPNNTMQRYIRVVVSLFILLTILNPIITLIRSDFHFREVEAGLEQWQSPHSSAVSTAAGKTPSEIAADAEKLRDISEQQTNQWIEQRLSEMIRQDLIEQGYDHVQEVRAQVELQSSGHAVISKVQVYLQQESDRALATEGDNNSESVVGRTGEQLVKPVDPVQSPPPIRVEIDWSSRQTAEPAAAQDHGEMEAIRSMQRTIRSYITEEWSVAPEQIVFYEWTR